MKNVKMWANTDEEAKSIINCALAHGLQYNPFGTENYSNGGFYFNEYYLTHSPRDDRTYFDDHKFEEFHFPAPVYLNTQEVIDAFLGKGLSEKPLNYCDNKPVVSDGLSTSYYQLKITNKDGDTIDCEMGDVIRCAVGDNFSLGNVLKAARRMYEASQGRGKKDVSMEYDANKIAYFAKEFADFYGSSNEK
jgi:hypothetical protein